MTRRRTGPLPAFGTPTPPFHPHIQSGFAARDGSLISTRIAAANQGRTDRRPRIVCAGSVVVVPMTAIITPLRPVGHNGRQGRPRLLPDLTAREPMDLPRAIQGDGPAVPARDLQPLASSPHGPITETEETW